MTLEEGGKLSQSLSADLERFYHRDRYLLSAAIYR